MFILPISEHYYTLAATGLKMKSYTFSSRENATNKMYEIMGKKDLHVVETWDDKHYKTYICNNGVRFYINRV